jgi:tetratricopeptide (TPR) repeat protein
MIGSNRCFAVATLWLFCPKLPARRSGQSAIRLLGEAFELALSAAAWDRAEFHLRHALALGIERSDWLLREGQWLIAQRRWPEAEEHLLGAASHIQGSSALAATLAHDLAYVELHLGEHEAAIARLSAFVEFEPAQSEAVAALEALWLRVLHRARSLTRAMEWLLAREGRHMLRPPIAGIGSLIALDEGNYEASLRWAEVSLGSATPPVEALVARASLALAERNAALSRKLLTTALRDHPQDGRVWSTLGFAELLDQRFSSARSAFARATTLMPEHIGTWHGLGWTALAQGDLPAAHKAFEAALALDRNVAESHGGLAVACALSGDATGARGSVARAIGLDKTSLSARYAEALLGGDARDTSSLMRLAERLFAGKRAPFGEDMGSIFKG